MRRPSKSRSGSGVDRHDCSSEQPVVCAGENAHREIEKGDAREGISKPLEFENNLLHGSEI